MTNQVAAQEIEVADLVRLAQSASHFGPVWTAASTDLNLNVLHFAEGQGVAEHVNTDVDVLILCLVGSGNVTIDNAEFGLGEGQAMVIPKGTTRSITATSDRFAYLTCHRRRGGLWPTASRTAETSESVY